MEEIKAIETIYNGYKFRSRLEARWAVFFDCMGIKYDYEPEGFNLKAGNYLPDFYLSELSVYVEIKSRPEVVDERDQMRWLEFSEKFPLLVFYGIPGEYDMTLFNDLKTPIWEDHPTFIINDIRYFGLQIVRFDKNPITKNWQIERTTPAIGNVFFDRAATISKQARFEFNDNINNNG